MSLIRLIVWALLFYVVYRVVGNVMKIVRAYNAKNTDEIKQPKNNTKYHIAKDDVIEAHFEDINPKKSDNSKENS